MTKLFIAFIALFVFTAILHADEKNANAQPTSQHRASPADSVFPAGQTESSFTRTVHGGVQHVIAKAASDTEVIKLIQAHLRNLAERFRQGDFSVTERMHGANMPGLAQLKQAQADDIKFEYRALDHGGQIHYSSEYPQYVSALHEWLDAQARDHGNANLPGHKQHHSSNSE